MATLENFSRVLLDLSYGALGYSGIPQETRLLFKVLNESASIETSGLLFGLTNAAIHKAPAHVGSRDRQIEHQADILFRLVHGDSAQGVGWIAFWNRLVAAWQDTRASLRALLGWRGRLGELNREAFWDVVWRRWLAPTLTDHDLDLVRRCPVYLSDISTAMLRVRCRLGLPAPRLDTRGFDFAVFHESRVIRVSPGTCKVIRHYDLIPVLRPDLVSSSLHVRGHMRAIRRCEGDSIFVCISESAREDLLRAFPQLRERAVTIPCALADDYYPERMPRLLPSIVAARNSSAAATHPPPVLRRLERTGLGKYLLFVSTIEPRKNHVALIRAYERVLARQRTDLCLVVVGAPGWQYEEATKALAPLVRRGRAFHLDNVPQAELRVLYSHAEAVVFPSLYEGFGYSPLEAMCCGAPAIASDVAAHARIYGGAAEYCDPYSVNSIARAIERVCLSPQSGRRDELIARGRRRVRRFRTWAVAAQRQALFEELRRQRITNNVDDARLNAFNRRLREIEDEHESRADLSTPTERCPEPADAA
jgi:glycosyltransferase involved in cell wall biosynthesis